MNNEFIENFSRKIRAPKSLVHTLTDKIIAVKSARDRSLDGGKANPYDLETEELNEGRRGLFEKIKTVIAYIEQEEAQRLDLNFEFTSAKNANYKHTKSLGSHGFFEPITEEVWLDLKNDSPELLFSTTLHEDIHRLSKQDFFYDSTEKIKFRRVGYQDYKTFVAFNEGVTEFYTQFLIFKYRDYILDIFPEFIESNFLFESTYDKEVELIETFVRTISKIFKLEYEDVSDVVIKGIFTGEKMWIRKLTRIYGSGVLIFLSGLSQVDSRVLSIFTTRSEKKRNLLMLEYYASINSLTEQPYNIFLKIYNITYEKYAQDSIFCNDLLKVLNNQILNLRIDRNDYKAMGIPVTNPSYIILNRKIFKMLFLRKKLKVKIL